MNQKKRRFIVLVLCCKGQSITLYIVLTNSSICRFQMDYFLFCKYYRRQFHISHQEKGFLRSVTNRNHDCSKESFFSPDTGDFSAFLLRKDCGGINKFKSYNCLTWKGNIMKSLFNCNVIVIWTIWTLRTSKENQHLLPINHS